MSIYSIMTPYDIESLSLGSILIGIMFSMMCLIAITSKEKISLKWFWLSLLAYALNDYGITLGRWMTRPVTEGLRWNWSGKILALSLSVIIICFLPNAMRDQIGLRFKQAEGNLRIWIGIGIYAFIFLAIALYYPPMPREHYWESLAFQLTMPSLDEELLYRGLLPVMLDRCFRVSRNILGAQMGWGAIISSVIFGLVHGASLKGGFSTDLISCAIPGLIGLIGCWIVQRTKSLLGPVLMHSYGNSIGFII